MGRKQKKRISLDWATKEPSVASNYSIPARNLRKTDLGAVIFGTTHNTINECLSHQLFGLPEGHYSYIKNIKQGLVLFLFNYSDRKLHGIFEAATPGQLNIDPHAWVTDRDGTGYTRYPAQVKVRVRTLCHPLSENQFGTIIARNYYAGVHFHFELDQDQTNRLVSLIMSSPMNSNISTKWNNLYASLPASTERLEYNAPVSTGMTNLWEPEVGGHALPGNLNQTSKILYASALTRTSTTSNIGSSSQPVGKWSALFKSESGSETVNDDKYGKESAPVQTWETGSSSLANTTKDKLPMNQQYEDDADFWQADTWEENRWLSDSDPQPNAAAHGNTWDENQHIVTTNVEVEQGHTSGYSGQARTWKENNWLSDSDPQANTAADGNAWDENKHIVTTKCEVEQNQTSGYGCQADTWEESHWRSESDPQANTVADGNTWDENPPLFLMVMATSTRTLNIGIIGFGPFSQFLAKTMIKQGHVIRATSRSDHSAHPGIHFFRDMEEFMRFEHDVILICSSILSASNVVKSIPFHCMKKPTLFADVLSVKEHPKQILLQEVPEDSDLVCTHPMFGPQSGKDGWKDLNFMYERVRVRDQDLCASFLNIFQSEGCKMMEMSCEEHDILAAESQFVSHTIGRILSEMRITNTPIDTKGFEKLLEVKESVANDSLDLYMGLFLHNRFAKQQMKNLESAVQSVKELLKGRMEQQDGCK